MVIHKPKSYLRYEHQFGALQREVLGPWYTWSRLVNMKTYEVVPLMYRVTDLYFLKGMSKNDRDEAVICYALCTWRGLVREIVKIKPTHPYMIFIDIDKGEADALGVMWPNIMYVPYPDQNYTFEGMIGPSCGFAHHVDAICGRMIGGVSRILVESVEEGVVHVSVDFNADGGSPRVMLSGHEDRRRKDVWDAL